MKIIAKYIFFVLSASLFFSSCSCSNTNEATNSDTINTLKKEVVTEKYKVIDNNNSKSQKYFVVTNVNNLDFVDSLQFGDTGDLYLGSSKTKKFEKLSDLLKIKYLKGVLKNDDGSDMPEDWMTMDIQAFIIGKRPKIGNFEPTIIKVYGTDCLAVVLVNIDNTGNVVSRFPIYKIENNSPVISEDTLVVTSPKIKCIFKNNTILTSTLTGTCNPKKDSMEHFLIKQINFKTTISNNGQFQTVRLDSTEFEKNCDFNYFQTH